MYKHVHQTIFIPGFLLTEILDRQKALMLEYMPVETANGFPQMRLMDQPWWEVAVPKFPAYPLTRDGEPDPNIYTPLLDNPHYQQTLRTIAGYITEETFESFTAEEIHSIEHYHEEISDIVHFWAQLCVRLGYTYMPFKPEAVDYIGMSSEEVKGTAITDFLHFLWGAMNTLKNKPWKQRLRGTDYARFEALYGAANYAFLQFLIHTGFDTEEKILALYEGKNRVNYGRLERGE